MKYLFEEETEAETRSQAARSARGEASTETEITLGMRSILGIFFGLILICGIFFGLGYSVGRGSSAQSGGPAPLSAAGGEISPESQASSDAHLSKPSPEKGAGAESASAPAANSTGASEGTFSADSDTAAATRPAAAVQTVAEEEESPSAPPAAQNTSAPSRIPGPAAPVTRPVPAPRATPAVAKAAAVPGAAPAAADGKSYMVQIAAVRLQEDAGVLVTALKKHGYSGIVRHEPQDQYLHVQVGPFQSRAEANTMRSRLLSDGYNAVVK